MAYSDVVLADSPVLYWRLGESSGSQADDDSGNTQHATIYGPPTLGATGLLVNDADTAFDFGGVGSGDIVRYDVSGFRNGDTSGCIELWFKSSAGAEGVLFASCDTATFNFAFDIHLSSAGAVRIKTIPSAGVYNGVSTVSTDWDDGAPHYLVVSSDGAGWTIEIDDTAQSLTTYLGTNTGDWFGDIANRDNVTAGAKRSNGSTQDEFDGVIDEVAVYSAPLSSARKTAHYLTGLDSAPDYLTPDAVIRVQAMEVLSTPGAVARVDTRPRFTPDAAIRVQAAEVLSTPGATIRVRSGLITAADAVLRVSTFPAVRAFAGIRVHKYEELFGVSAAVRVRTSHLAPVAAARVRATETLSAPGASIQVQKIDTATINRTARHWQPLVSVGGVDVSLRLAGRITIDNGEDRASTAEFSLMPAAGAIDLLSYVGQAVTIHVRDLTAAGVVNYTVLRFSGLVSDPTYDPANATITLRCTTDTIAAANQMDRPAINALVGGQYSPHVFEQGAQGWDYLVDQLETTTASVWHSPRGLRVTDWTAKATADVELGAGDVISGSEEYRPASRVELLNEVRVSFAYRFQRKRQRTLACSWSTPQTWCDFLINGWDLCQRSMVETAAAGAGWTVQGAISYTDLPPAGYYRCLPSSPGSTSKYIGWGRSFGGYLLDDPDSEALCWGASWKAARRWAQTVTENYTITITAPESISGNGRLGRAESYALECIQSVDEWLSAQQYTGTDSETGYTTLAGGAADGSLVLGDIAKDATEDTNTGRTAADQVRRCAIAYGRARIVESHRLNRATAVSRFQPGVDPTKTVRINTPRLVAKAKAARVLDTFDIATGQAQTRVELAVSRQGATGVVTESPTDPDAAPAYTTETDIPTRLDMQTRIGGLTTSPAYDESWTGYTANYRYDPTDTNPFAANPADPQAKLYPRTFSVEYPAIEGAHLNAIEKGGTQAVDVAIPNDELTLNR